MMRCDVLVSHPILLYHTLPYSGLAADPSAGEKKASCSPDNTVPLEGARVHVLVLQQDMSFRMSKNTSLLTW